MNSQPESAAGSEDSQLVYATALRLLARRDHSPLELRNKLLMRHFDEVLVAAVLDELVERNLLSDQRFAEVFVRGRFARGYGPLRIRAELRERGVGEQVIEGVLAELSGAWNESVVRQREKRFGASYPDDYRELARQKRFLQQRGFSGDQIQAAFRE